MKGGAIAATGPGTDQTSRALLPKDANPKVDDNRGNANPKLRATIPEVVLAGQNATVDTNANSGGPSFHPGLVPGLTAAQLTPQATLQANLQNNLATLFRDCYARGRLPDGVESPNHMCYIDFVVQTRQLGLPYKMPFERHDIVAHMHGLGPDDGNHLPGTYTLLGINRYDREGELLGNAGYPPHVGVAVGTLLVLPQSIPGLIRETVVHEVGHVLIGNFENVIPFHREHSAGSRDCAFSGTPDPRAVLPLFVCPRHANLLRDRVSLEFGQADANPKQSPYGDSNVKNDSTRTRTRR